MEDDAPVIYGLEFQGRALAPRAGENDAIHFLVGTQSLKHDNQVHLLEFDDDSNFIDKSIYLHLAGEINHISSSPADRNILSTCFSAVEENKLHSGACVWRLPPREAPALGSSGTLPSMDEMCRLREHDGLVKCTLWHPGGDGNRMVSLDHKNLRVWDIDVGSSSAKQVGSTSLDVRPTFNHARWNPHLNCVQVATAIDAGVQGWDIRSMKRTFSIDNAHGQMVRDLDFNPNRQYHLVTCGDDCLVKFWDTRHLDEPLKTCKNHSHWVWSVRYNHFHDQMIVSSSSDSRVVLLNMSSISSEPIGHVDDEDEIDDRGERQPIPDGVLSRYEEHEDSVYAAEWSTADPWIFASLSYDGRVVINRVPRSIKYKILL